MLILKRIARKEGIEVDEVNVKRLIEEKAVEFGANPDALKAEFEKGRGDSGSRIYFLRRARLIP